MPEHEIRWRYQTVPSIFISVTPTHLQRNRKHIAFKRVLDKAVKKISASLNVNSWVYVFLTFCVKKWKACTLLYTERPWFSEGKSFHVIKVSRASHFCHGISYLLERTTNRQTTVIRTWVFGRHFIFLEKRMKCTCHYSKNNSPYLLPVIISELSRES